MKLKDKIAYVHSGEWPSKSPSTTFATNTVIGLSEIFNKCYFYIKRNSDKTSNEILENYFNTKKPDNLFIQQVDKTLWDSNSLFFKKIYKQLSKRIKNNQIDAVISRHVKFLPYLAKLKKKFEIPTFFESHDFYGDLSQRNDLNSEKKQKQQKLEIRYIPQISGLICLQNSQKKIYRKYFPKIPIYIARTGIKKLYKNTNNHDRKFITYIGSLDPLKGVDFLIKSLHFTKSKPQLLIIGGKNQEEINRIENLAENHYLKNKVKITGWINKKEMHNYLEKTKIGVIPLKNTFFNQYLTSPLKLFDYYSYGIPVIASDLPTTRELIEENKTGLFFETENSQQLAQKIDDLINDELKIKNMRSNIFKNSQKFLWTERAKVIYNFINAKEENHE